MRSRSSLSVAQLPFEQIALRERNERLPLAIEEANHRNASHQPQLLHLLQLPMSSCSCCFGDHGRCNSSHHWWADAHPDTYSLAATQRGDDTDSSSSYFVWQERRRDTNTNATSPRPCVFFA